MSNGVVFVVEGRRIVPVSADESTGIMVLGGTRFHKDDIMALSDDGRAQLSDLVQGALPKRNARQAF